MIYVIAAFAASAVLIYLTADSVWRSRSDYTFAAPRRFVFIFLSLTWGLPMTLAGAFAALFLLLTGHRPRRFGYCALFELPRVGFGLSLGPFLIAPADDRLTAAHEHGHSLQNVYLGPFMPFCVSLPSAVRYHCRNLKMKIAKKPCRRKYDAIWFEHTATESGMELHKRKIL